jgi:hypothetical protein
MPHYSADNPPPMWALAFAALKRAGRKVAMDAKANGTTIVIWRDGRVVETLVDDIPPLDEWDIPPPARPSKER